MMPESRSKLMLAIVVALLWASVSFAGPITLTIYPNIQPNPGLSPSWTGYYTTAITAIGNDISSSGAGSTAYQVVGEFLPGDIISSSGFHSWRGSISGPYPNEHGNYLGFGRHVVGDSTQQFSLAGLSYAMSSNDVGSGCPAGTSGAWCRTGGYGTADPFTAYNAYTVGINWGGNRARGGGDGTIFTSGPASQLIDELVYVGVAGTFDASSAPGATPQDQVNYLINYANNWGFTADIEYCMHYDGAGCGESVVSVVPEPGTSVLFVAGLLGLLALHCRRNKR